MKRPRIQPSADIRFLTKEELEALIGAIDVAEKPYGTLDRAIVLTAAMTGCARESSWRFAGAERRCAR